MRTTYWLFQLYLWSTVFVPAAAQERSELLTQIAGKGSELAIEFRASDNTTYLGRFADGGGPPILKLPRTDWEGLRRLHYGWRTLENMSDETTLSVQLEAFEYDDGTWAGAIAILNDSLRHPVGTLEGDLVMILGPRVIFSRRRVVLHDQCGFAVQFGQVKWAPNRAAAGYFYLMTQPPVEDFHEHNGLAWTSPLAKWTGVSRWNVSNLARAAIVTGRPEFREMALEYKAVAERERSGGSVPGGGSWASGDFWLWRLDE